MNASDYLENKILNHLLTGVTFTPPTLYMALYTSSTGLESNAPTGEVAGGGYARVRVSDFGGYTSASGGVSSNAANIEFPTASSAWGTVTHLALCDAASAGNVLVYSALSTSRDVTAGDAVRVRTGQHTITLS